jgi:DNA-directed RNA polymerase subunit RPC12/RpoP
MTVDQAPGTSSPTTLTFPCGRCGARLEYAPGTTALRCPYCGHEQAVAAGDDAVVEEHDYVAWQSSPVKATAHVGRHVLRCRQCAATTETDDLSTSCPFCGAPIVAEVDLAEQIAPEGVVPFGLDRDAAQTAIRTWVGSRWFAPNRLRKVGTAESLKGTYLPHWTFDASTTTRYSGLRGEHYWESQTYTEMVDGRPQTRTRQVMKTRWYPASGVVGRAFDDVVVVATRRLAPERLADLSPWLLEDAVAYQPEYLSGYQTLRYDVEPDEGLEEAKQQMRSVIRDDCRADIGGDEQQVHSMDTRYADLMFKLMLLPVWLAAYLYAGRSWQVYVNAHTGNVVGERPYSVVKIAFAVLAALVVVGIVVALYVLNRGQTQGLP